MNITELKSIPELKRTLELRKKLSLLTQILWEHHSQSRLMYIAAKEMVLLNSLIINALRESDEAFISNTLPNEVVRNHMKFRSHLTAIADERIIALVNYTNKLRVS